jgi:hypothetical protein
MTARTTPIRRLLALALPAALAASAVALTAPAPADAAKWFGAELTENVQPSNSMPAHPCSLPGSCTRVLNDAYGAPGRERAPKKGRVRTIKLIAGGPGSFRLQLVKVKGQGDDAKVKVKRQGPVINYTGQGDPEAETYKVEKFKVRVKVKKGWYLAAKGDLTSMLRCSSGGPNILELSPGLPKRSPFTKVSDTDGCWLLMEAKIKRR